MRKGILFLVVAAMNIAAYAQKPLMTINGKPVSAEEFLYIYEKNNQAGAKIPRRWTSTWICSSTSNSK